MDVGPETAPPAWHLAAESSPAPLLPPSRRAAAPRGAPGCWFRWWRGARRRHGQRGSGRDGRGERIRAPPAPKKRRVLGLKQAGGGDEGRGGGSGCSSPGGRRWLVPVARVGACAEEGGTRSVAAVGPVSLSSRRWRSRGPGRGTRRRARGPLLSVAARRGRGVRGGQGGKRRGEAGGRWRRGAQSSSTSSPSESSPAPLPLPGPGGPARRS